MEIRLSIQDRTAIMALIPERPEGGRIDMMLTYDILKKVDFTPAEVEELDIVEDDRGMSYKKDCEIVVEFTERQIGIIDECITLADARNRINIQMCPFIYKIDHLKNK